MRAVENVVGIERIRVLSDRSTVDSVGSALRTFVFDTRVIPDNCCCKMISREVQFRDGRCFWRLIMVLIWCYSNRHEEGAKKDSQTAAE